MSKSKDLNKEKLIKKELAKLKNISDKLDGKTKKVVESLINEAAFMGASLFELREIINVKGYTEKYQNGANQSGTKNCSEVDIYIKLSKNYMSIIKQLTDLVKVDDKDNSDDDFDNFVADRDG